MLTAELCGRIVEVCATFPQWSVPQVYAHLRQQGVAVTQAQVEQAVVQSGWRQLQQTLSARYALGATTYHLREEWLVSQLLTQVQALLVHLETNQPLTPELRTTVADLTTVATTVGCAPQPALPATPWLLRVEQVLFHAPAPDTAPPAAHAPPPPDTTATIVPVAAGPVCCPVCGSDQVGRKSATPRWKQYYDTAHQLCQVAVYRYYCRNPLCPQGSFTHLPPGLTPYSPYRTELHLLAVQMYAWGYAT